MLTKVLQPSGRVAQAHVRASVLITASAKLRTSSAISCTVQDLSWLSQQISRYLKAFEGLIPSYSADAASILTAFTCPLLLRILCSRSRW